MPRPDITARVERCNAAAFSMTMRLYSAGARVSRAISKVRRAIVSHDASIISVIIKGSARLRRAATGRACGRHGRDPQPLRR